MRTYEGLYRGIVVDDEDPEKRLRYRVRVYGVHAENLTKEFLPWAEWASLFATNKAGDFPCFLIGEVVWVMFEGADRRLPVIMGGWITHPENGVNAVPQEKTEDYPKTCRRWIRRDRKGNTIIQSELEEENYVKIISGKATITVSQKDDTITIETVKGAANLTAKRINMIADEIVLDANAVTHNSRGVTGGNQPNGKSQCVSNSEANLCASIDGAGGGGTSTVGGYTQKFRNKATAIVQGLLSWVRSKNITIGVASHTTDAGMPVPVTEVVSTRATKLISDQSEDVGMYEAKNGVRIDTRAEIGSAGEIVEDSPDLPANGDIEIRARRDIQGQSERDTFFQATRDAKLSAAHDATLSASHDVIVLALGEATVRGEQFVTIKSSVKIKIVAPSVEISSS